LSGQVQPLHCCNDPPPAYPPERTIGGARTFTLQDRGLVTSYTPAITGGKKLQSEERAAQLFDVRVYGFVSSIFSLEGAC